MKYDFHSHSKYSSDGFPDPKKIVKTAVKRGLSGIAITDHNTIKGGIEAKKYETDEFKVVVGSEIKTDRGEVIGLFLCDEIRSKVFHEVVDEIRNQNGIVVVPHPFDRLRGKALYPSEDETKLIDNMEVFNSRCMLNRYNEKAAEFARTNNLKIIAGSDAHFLSEIGNGGVITESEDIHEAVKKGDFTVFGQKSHITNLGLSELLSGWRMLKGN